ncbi:MAG TPA: efflux RND transporter periplasmic adaptor subunit [Gemmataceae bacterium]|nr:efflux RND transporter periplasmic adaptor subunit [Gemmataceae bacterium]
MVAVVRPERTSLYWTIRQPGSIEAFEEAPILPKISGYVEEWKVDIGDQVRKGQLLATLWVPESAANLRQKEAAVNRDEVQILLARTALQAAEANVAKSEASLRLAEAGLVRAESNAARWRSQYRRDAQLVRNGSISMVDFEVTTDQYQTATAAKVESVARVAAAKAALTESKAQRDKSAAEVRLAEANLRASQADRDAAAALLHYARIEAPFDGVITRRTISRGDFVQPPATAPQEPLYVLHRRDLMRVFVDVPESDAVWVQEGAPARIRVPILQDREFDGKVRRVSYALKRQTRTLRAEIDLPNPDDLLRSGMYAYAAIQVERSNTLTLPASAISTQGDVNEGYQDYCFLWENGKVRRTPIKIGSRGEGRVEVLKKRNQGGDWEDFTEAEMVVEKGLSALSDGQEAILAADKK